jgi:PKD repeat protein
MKTVFAGLICVIVMGMGSCGKDNKPDDSTKANFSITGYESAVPTTVSFFNTSTNGTSYLWAFGDGTTSTQFNPVHNYTAIGTYYISLKTTGPKGVDSVCKVMALGNLQDPSKSNFSYFMDRCQGTPANVVFYSINPSSTGHAWDFGNGVTALDRSAIIRYESSGTYLVKYSSIINGVRDTVSLGIIL